MRKWVALFVLVLALPCVLAGWEDSSGDIPVQLDRDYLTVVGHEASPIDVITAANFAASMSGALGVSFSGTTDDVALDNFRREDLDTRLVVVIEGSKATIIEGFGMSDEAESAALYFEGQGMTVTRIDSDDAEARHLSVTYDVPSWQYLPEDDDTDDAADDSDDGSGDWVPRDDGADDAGDAAGQCNGCKASGQCFSTGTGVLLNGERKYCSPSGLFKTSVGVGGTCNNDYECISRICEGGSCQSRGDDSGELEEAGHDSSPLDNRESPLKKFWHWLTGLFG